jgi:hypothetical protein
MDYDDLLVNWRLLMTDFEGARAVSGAVRAHPRGRVPGHQPPAGRVIRLMAGRRSNLMVVGDDCQAIYSFRGARCATSSIFRSIIRARRCVRLETNYRSIPQVLEIANASIRHNRHQYDKDAEGHAGPGERPAYAILTDGHAGAVRGAAGARAARRGGRAQARSPCSTAPTTRPWSCSSSSSGAACRSPFAGPALLRAGPHPRPARPPAMLVNPLDQLAWLRVLKLRDGIGNRHASTLYPSSPAAATPSARCAGHGRPRAAGRARKSFEEVRELLLDLTRPSMVTNPQALFELVLAAVTSLHLRASAENAEQRSRGHPPARPTSPHSSTTCRVSWRSSNWWRASPPRTSRRGDSRTSAWCCRRSTRPRAWSGRPCSCSASPRASSRWLAPCGRRTKRKRSAACSTWRSPAPGALYLCHPQWGRDRERSRVLLRPSRFVHEILSRRPDLVEKWQIGERR